MSEEMTKFERLIVKTLAQTNETTVKEIMTEAIIDRLKNYDCQKVFAAVVDPVLREMVKEMLKESSILELLQKRLQQEVNGLVGRIKVELKTRGY